MLNLTFIARILLGLMGALAASGYCFPVLKVVEVVCGALLLAGRFVPLALVLLAPVVVQILPFQIALEPAGTPMAVLSVLLTGYLGFVGYRSSFQSVLSPTQDS